MRGIRKKDKSLKKYKYLALGGLFIIALLIGSTDLFSAYTSGWEISTNFDSVRIEDTNLILGGSATGFIDNTYVNTRGGYVKLDNGEPAQIYGNSWPYWLQSNFDAAYTLRPELFGSVGVSIDVDSPYPVMRDAYGDEWYKSTDGSPYRTYEKTEGDTTWFYDHYVYFYTVDIETNGKAEIGSGNYVYGTCEGLPSIHQIDNAVDVRVFSDFSLKPWSVEDGQIYTFNDTSVETTDVFYGIMSASVAGLELGDTDESVAEGELLDEIDQTFEGLIDPHKDHVGAALAMFRDGDIDYTGYDAVLSADAEDVVKVMPNTIPRSVTIETGASLEAGLVVEGVNTWAAWAPVNKYVRYVIRVDAVYTAGLVLITGEQDPAEEKKEEQKLDDITTIWESITEELHGLFKQYEMLIYLVIVAVIAIGAVIVIIQLKPLLMGAKVAKRM